MSNILIIGAGGVGRVVVHKCVQVPEVFSKITLASRTLSKCTQIAESLPGKIDTDELDADQIPETVKLIRTVKPDLVINVALPYQNLPIMDACLETGTNYLDTANYEPLDEAKFEYRWQWDYHERFKAKGIVALLGSGFDPGVTNVFTAHALKNHFTEVDSLDIIDCNAGDHGHPFATNFNPEINIREITQEGKSYEDGVWKMFPAMSVFKDYAFSEGIGLRRIYQLYHEELESLVKHFPQIKTARFWMTFSENYLRHLEVIQNIGMASIKPINYEGKQIVPLQFLKALLPDPGSLGIRTKGKTWIGCRLKGSQNGEKKRYVIYNSCVHEKCFQEVGSQAISYTTGVPAMIGAKMILTKKWQGKGVFNIEQFDPKPFLDDLNTYGLPWKEILF